MLKFYNREAELTALDGIHKSARKSARFTYIVGPRRIGKTFLIEQFFKDLRKTDLVVYLFVERKTSAVLLAEWREILAGKLEFVPQFKSWDDFWGFIVSFYYATNYPKTYSQEKSQNDCKPHHLAGNTLFLLIKTLIE